MGVFKISKISFIVAMAASLTMFLWPLLSGATSIQHQDETQTVFVLLMPVLLLVAIADLTSAGIDSRQVAILAVLIALNSMIRMLGAGTAGIETAFFLIIIAASVFGSSFGYLLGAGSLFVSAILSGGIGPWLPFQMMAAGLVGIGAGLLPKIQHIRTKTIVLVCYAVPASFIYGWLMTIWNWPFLLGTGSSISYDAGVGSLENLRRFIAYDIFSGGLLWDLGRAITSSILILVTGPALLQALARVANRAGFEKF